MTEMIERAAEAAAVSDGYKGLISVPREKREGYLRRAKAMIDSLSISHDRVVGTAIEHIYPGQLVFVVDGNKLVRAVPADVSRVYQ